MIYKYTIVNLFLLCFFVAGCQTSKKTATGNIAATEPAVVKRTQAEISHKTGGSWENRKYLGGTFQNVQKLVVPAEHTDHSEYIRYEGPGWESDKIGYRFYLDWRNAVDIFGKTTSKMVLQEVGLDGFSSYHEPQEWGMDVLKVGSSLGIGSIAYWDGKKAIRIEKTDGLECEILENGNTKSTIKTTYKGWEIAGKKTDLKSYISIGAGSRMSYQQIELSSALENICTGIVKHENGELITKLPAQPGEWGYLATYGKQSLADDNLGMAILFRKESIIKLTEDAHSHIIVLAPEGNSIDYYFGAAWQQEQGGIKTKEDFISYLEEEVKSLK